MELIILFYKLREGEKHAAAGEVGGGNFGKDFEKGYEGQNVLSRQYIVLLLFPSPILHLSHLKP